MSRLRWAARISAARATKASSLAPSRWKPDWPGWSRPDFCLPGQPGTLGGQCRRRLRRRSAGAAGEGQEGQQEESAKQGHLPWKLERPAHPGRANSRSFPRKSDAPPDFQNPPSLGWAQLPSFSFSRYQAMPSASSGERSSLPPGKVMCGTLANRSKPSLCWPPMASASNCPARCVAFTPCPE